MCKYHDVLCSPNPAKKNDFASELRTPFCYCTQGSAATTSIRRPPSAEPPTTANTFPKEVSQPRGPKHHRTAPLYETETRERSSRQSASVGGLTDVTTGSNHSGSPVAAVAGLCWLAAVPGVDCCEALAAARVSISITPSICLISRSTRAWWVCAEQKSRPAGLNYFLNSDGCKNYKSGRGARRSNF